MHPLDSPYTIPAMLGLAMVELGYTAQQFYQCPAKDFGAALRYLRQKKEAEAYATFNAHKRLVYSIAEIMVGSPQKIADYYEIRTYPQTPLAQQPHKVEQLLEHFKSSI